MKLRIHLGALTLALLCSLPVGNCKAQDLPPADRPRNGAMQLPPDGHGLTRSDLPGPDHVPAKGLQVGPPGRWWDDPRMIAELNLTADQQKRMDSVFVQSRMKLIDLTATLQKEELQLDPLLAADKPDGTRVLTQLDRVAQARAELEKANGRMLFGLRNVLTIDQWKKLQSHEPPPHGQWH